MFEGSAAKAAVLSLFSGAKHPYPWLRRLRLLWLVFRASARLCMGAVPPYPPDFRFRKLRFVANFGICPNWRMPLALLPSRVRTAVDGPVLYLIKLVQVTPKW